MKTFQIHFALPSGIYPRCNRPTLRGRDDAGLKVLASRSTDSCYTLIKYYLISEWTNEGKNEWTNERKKEERKEVNNVRWKAGRKERTSEITKIRLTKEWMNNLGVVQLKTKSTANSIDDLFRNRRPWLGAVFHWLSWSRPMHYWLAAIDGWLGEWYVIRR